MYFLAIDLGGTKTASAVVDPDGAVLGYGKRAATPRVEDIAAEAARAVEAAGLGWEEVAAAGVIVPGIYSRQTGRAWAPNLWGNDEVGLAEELGRTIPVALHIGSDRDGYVLGESWLGVARGCRDVVFLAVGTGIGAGVLAGGRLLRGAGGIAGAVGWFALRPEMLEAYGRMGCWEAEAAGPAVAAMAGAPSAEVAVQRARDHDANAVRAVEHAIEYLGMGIANVVSMLNPEVVVLGGGLLQADDLFLEPVRRAAARWAQPIAFRQVRIERTALGERAGLLGAARLAMLEES